jgi:hypothetical protein
LVKHGVPYDVALAFPDGEALAFLAAFGWLERHSFDPFSLCWRGLG